MHAFIYEETKLVSHEISRGLPNQGAMCQCLRATNV
jgi:hypothetical protein